MLIYHNKNEQITNWIDLKTTVLSGVNEATKAAVCIAWFSLKEIQELVKQFHSVKTTKKGVTSGRSGID